MKRAIPVGMTEVAAVIQAVPCAPIAAASGEGRQTQLVQRWHRFAYLATCPDRMIVGTKR